MTDTDRTLTGPWRATLSSSGGFLIAEGESLVGEDYLEVSVVRGSALPIDDERMPGNWMTDDRLYTDDSFDSDEDVWFRYALAKRVAEALNGLDAAGGVQ